MTTGNQVYEVAKQVADLRAEITSLKSIVNILVINDQASRKPPQFRWLQVRSISGSGRIITDELPRLQQLINGEWRDTPYVHVKEELHVSEE